MRQLSTENLDLKKALTELIPEQQVWSRKQKEHPLEWAMPSVPLTIIRIIECIGASESYQEGPWQQTAWRGDGGHGYWRHAGHPGEC